MDDAAIVALYWARSQQALTCTEEKYGSFCHAIAYRILENHQDAEESVSDTWLSAWNAMPPHRPECLSAFLGKLTRNISIDRWRKRSAGKRGGTSVTLALEELEGCIPAGENTEQVVEAMVLTDALNRFFASLPGEKRRIFLYRYWYLAPISQIAADYAISESRVKMSLLRTRKALRAFLEKEGIDL